jgi:hypothetical protein
MRKSEIVPCPECGGQCKREQVGWITTNQPSYKYESLVVGKVVSEGWFERKERPPDNLWRDYRPEDSIPALVFRAREKEEQMPSERTSS